MKRLAVLPLLFAAACAMPPEGVDDAAVLRFNDAVKSMGCKLVTEPHYLATELQTGLTREQVMAMVAYKVSLEEATPIEGGGHAFTSGGCA